MKLLMVTQEKGGGRRFGLGKSLVPVIEELERRGHEVGYLTQDDLGPKAQWLLGRVVTLLMRGWGDALGSLLGVVVAALLVGRQAALKARREGYGHLHCHNAFIALGVWLWLPLWRAPRWGVTVHSFRATAQAVHRHVTPLGSFLRWLFRVAERRVLLRASWVVMPSESGRRQIVEDLGLARMPPRWVVIPHLLPRIRRYERGEARRRLGWEREWLTVVGVGMLVPMKGFDRLVVALGRVTSDQPVQLVLVGEGDQEGMIRLAREVGLARPPLFAVTDDVGLYLSAADLYVSASSTESFGLANVEAVLAGTPAICSAVGAVPEVIGGAAWLTTPEVEALCYAIQQFIDFAPLRRPQPRRQRLLGGHWPSDDDIIARYLEVYSRP